MNPFETQLEAATSARQRGDRPAEATALTDLGVMHLRSGDAPKAIATLTEALELARALNDPVRTADAQANLGMALLDSGRSAEAQSQCESALASARAGRNSFLEKMILENLGVIAARQGDRRKALALFREAESIAERLSDWQHLAELHWFQAIQHAEYEDRDSALLKGEAAIAALANRDEARASIYRENLAKYRRGQSLPPVFPGGMSVTSIDRSTGAEPVGPSLLHMALSAAQALGRFLGSGMKTTSAEVRSRRLETCKSCEHHTGVRCLLCGCFTDLKTRLPHEACPAGRW